MGDKLNKILMIDQDIHYFIEDNNDLNDLEFEEQFQNKNFIEQAISILSKMSSKDILEVIKRSQYLWNFIDLKKFIKKYPLNKTYLKNNKDKYIEEYKKLQNTCYYISNISNNFQDFQDYIRILEIDNVEKYLLTNMPNEQIYTLSSLTSSWNEKLYFFSYFKQKDI